MQNFSRRLDTAIANSGKSKGSLAEHCDVALSTVSRWLGGSVPQNDTLTKIADYLDVSAAWLLTGHGPAVFRQTEPESSMLREEPIWPRTPNAPPEKTVLPDKTAADSLEASVSRIAGALERIAAAMELNNKKDPQS